MTMNDSNDVDEVIDKYEQLESLRSEINSKIGNIEESGDEKALQRLDKFKNKHTDFFESLNDDDVDSDEVDDQIRSMTRFNSLLDSYDRLKANLEKEINIDPSRLMGLTDGIFGMCMTLLVFGLALPEVELTSETVYVSFLDSILPNVGAVLVSFVLLSSFWIYHHQFIKLRGLNTPYLWVNVLYLACISFIPFSTLIISTYGEYFISEVIFGFNILLTTIFFLLMYYYASKRGFLEDEVSSHENRYVRNTLILIICLTIVVTLGVYLVNPNFMYLYLLIPVISTIRDISYKL